MKKKIVIMAFPEGVSGIHYTRNILASADSREVTEFAVRKMYADANVVIETLLSQGHEVVFCDAHNVGHQNCNKPHLSTVLLNSAIKNTPVWGLHKALEGVDGAIILGCPARNGAEDAFCSYTLNDVAYFEYSLNRTVYGEIGVAAIFFGIYDIPVIGICSDYGAVKEAKELLGDIPALAVKKAKIRNVAHPCFTEEETKEKIAEFSLQAVAGIDACKPYIVQGPYEAKVVHTSPAYCDEALTYYVGLDSLERIDALTAIRRKEKIVSYDDLVI